MKYGILGNENFSDIDVHDNVSFSTSLEFEKNAFFTSRIKFIFVVLYGRIKKIHRKNL